MSENKQPEHQNTAPPQGQMYIPPQYYAPQDDEIDLRELFGVLWKGKWWTIGITTLFAIASVFYALSLPNEYKATAIVAPASDQGGGGLSSLAGQFGGLASIAGVSLGSAESNDVVIAMELMQTWGFTEEFIKKHNLQAPIFGSNGWSWKTKELIYDEDIYDSSSKKWVREAPKGKTVEPTSWELYETFKENLVVYQNIDTSLISVEYMHYSPQYAQKIVTWLIEDVNAIMKERALSSAAKNIAYLEGQIAKTQLSDMQSIFYSLIEEQTKTKMLAEVGDEFVFRNISSPHLPEEPEKPNRLIIVLIGLLAGIFLSLAILFFKRMAIS